ncbi:hypothetical protein JXA34_01850 [Patescibacteria group bacterium]|nr:hypothetical protein [Patescibacteria group bacterium]
MHRSDEQIKSSGREQVIKYLTEGTSSGGIEHASQEEVEDKLRAYFAEMKDDLEQGNSGSFVRTLKTSMGVALAGAHKATVIFLTTGTSSEGIGNSPNPDAVAGDLSAHFQEIRGALDMEDNNTAVNRIEAALGVCLAGDRIPTVQFLTEDTESEGIEFEDVAKIKGQLSYYFSEMTRNLEESDSASFTNNMQIALGVALAAK